MADKKISELPTTTSLTENDLFLVIQNTDSSPTSKNVTVGSVFSEVPVEASFPKGVEANTVTTDVLNIKETVTPIDSIDVESLYGTIGYDDNYLYIKVNSTTIKRIKLDTF